MVAVKTLWITSDDDSIPISSGNALDMPCVSSCLMLAHDFTSSGSALTIDFTAPLTIFGMLSAAFWTISIIASVVSCIPFSKSPDKAFVIPLMAFVTEGKKLETTFLLNPSIAVFMSCNWS